MKKLAFVSLLLFALILLQGIVSCVRPTVEQASQTIPVSDARYIISFRNDNWIDGAIFVKAYEVKGDTLFADGYYDRNGFHSATKAIPVKWIIEIEDREKVTE